MRHWFSDINVKPIAFIGAALAYFAVALASWLPAAYRPDIVLLSDKFEHALAYLLLGVLSVIATRQIVHPRWIGLALVAYAGVLELGQLLVPGRVASAADFLASAAGAIVGVWLTTLAVRRLNPGKVARVET
jgi:VanZ family protein